MYLIPQSKLDKVKKSISKLESKGVKIKFKVNDDLKYILINDQNYYGFYETEINFNYLENNWRFIGTLEHTDNGNIIRNVTEDVTIPDIYKEVKPTCDHCQTDRNRKDTYIIQNVRSKVFKQVGKICLLEYTKSLDPKICSEIISLNNYLDSFNNLETLDPETLLYDTRYINAKYLKCLAYQIVSNYGYEKRDTINRIYTAINNKENYLDNMKMIKKIDQWAETLNPNNNYLSNALVAWKLDYVEERHYALIASFIYSYIRDNQREKGVNLNNFKQKVGDKIKIKVKEFRVLYTKDTYSYTPELTKVYRIVDDKGYVYIWSTLKSLDDAVELTATIKEFNSYRDEEQIVITRGKVTKSLNDDKVNRLINIIGS